MAADYEVLGLASESCHYFWNSFLELHGMSFLWVFSFVLVVGRTRLAVDRRAEQTVALGLWLLGFAGAVSSGSLRYHSRMVD